MNNESHVQLSRHYCPATGQGCDAIDCDEGCAAMPNGGPGQPPQNNACPAWLHKHIKAMTILESRAVAVGALGH